jgi:hypothetical protein
VRTICPPPSPYEPSISSGTHDRCESTSIPTIRHATLRPSVWRDTRPCACPRCLTTAKSHDGLELRRGQAATTNPGSGGGGDSASVISRLCEPFRSNAGSRRIEILETFAWHKSCGR